MTKDKILSLTISALELPSATRNRFLKGYCREKGLEVPETRKDCEALAAKLTVSELIESYDRAPKEFWWASLERLTEKLAEFGLTRLDWFFLPQSTMTTEVISSLSKQEWLDQPAVLLGTVSNQLLQRLNPYSDPNPRTYLVRALLEGVAAQKYSWTLSYLCKNHRSSVENTRRVLRGLGFTYEDGWFMQFGTRRAAIKDVMSSYDVSEPEAEQVVDIARDRDWVGRFLE
jgi:hypothetical protein